MKNSNPPQHRLSYFPKPHLILIGGLLILLILGQLLMEKQPDSPSTEAPDIKTIQATPPTPKPEDLWDWRTAKVMNGDSLSVIFKRMNISIGELDKILASDEHAKQLTELYPGKTGREQE